MRSEAGGGREVRGRRAVSFPSAGSGCCQLQVGSRRGEMPAKIIEFSCRVRERERNKERAGGRERVCDNNKC